MGVPPPGVAAALAVVAAVVCWLASTAAATAGDAGDDPALRHVTRITGSREYGFHVTWSDGRHWWTPTLSETLAECTEYDRAVRRARCVTGARTRYRWMGVTKRSLRHR